VFDKIVSVSETLKQINQKKLAKYVRPEQMVAVPNSLTLPGDNKENETHSAVVIEDYQAPAKANKFAMQMFHSLIAVSEQAASTIQLKPKDTIRVLGRAQIKQHYFYKLAINDLPRGWVMGQDIVVQENNELLDQQSHNQIGWVYNNKRRLFKTPYLKGNDTAKPYFCKDCGASGYRRWSLLSSAVAATSTIRLVKGFQCVTDANG
jgi:hypothetical protein